MRYRAFLAGILAMCCFLSDLHGVPDPLRSKANRTVIPGTCTWNIEMNKVGGEKGDLWWQHSTRTERYLVAQHGAVIGVVAEKYERIDLEYLKAATFANEKISGSDNNNLLLPGTVLAVRTRNGNFAKIKVVRYYMLHDFTFPGSEVLTEQWKQFALQSPNRDLYNIEVEWVLYKSE